MRVLLPVAGYSCYKRDPFLAVEGENILVVVMVVMGIDCGWYKIPGGVRYCFR